MVSKHFTVSNAQGFHMRPATTFANTMAKYGCKVTIKHNGADVDGKSLMHNQFTGESCSHCYIEPIAEPPLTSIIQSQRTLDGSSQIAIGILQ